MELAGIIKDNWAQITALVGLVTVFTIFIYKILERSRKVEDYIGKSPVYIRPDQVLAVSLLPFQPPVGTVDVTCVRALKKDMPATKSLVELMSGSGRKVHALPVVVPLFLISLVLLFCGWVFAFLVLSGASWLGDKAHLSIGLVYLASAVVPLIVCQAFFLATVYWRVIGEYNRLRNETKEAELNAADEIIGIKINLLQQL